MTLSNFEEKAHFSLLQSSLPQDWNNIEDLYDSNFNLIVVPSMTLEAKVAQKIKWLNHYEERLLFSIAHLRNPNAHVIYLSSLPLHPDLINYYLQLFPGIVLPHARDRLTLLSTYDASSTALTQKILERPRLIEKIKQISHSTNSCLVCFSSTDLERKLSVELNIPLFALDPDLSFLGSKTGSQQIFNECKIPYPTSSSLVNNGEELGVAVDEVWQSQPSLERVVIKLNNGFSGFGNALFSLKDFGSRVSGCQSAEEKINIICKDLTGLKFQYQEENWESFEEKIEEQGAIVEAFIEGKNKCSPSVQGHIMPNGEVEILSTHDQILGGPDGMTYLGCSFPANSAYQAQIQEMTRRIGINLASKGVLECFSVDFLVLENSSNTPSSTTIYGIEINLRKGGTTHPYLLLKLLTRGSYDVRRNLFRSQRGSSKYYIASDNLQNSKYRGLLFDDLIAIVVENRLHFNRTTETGVVLHLTATLSEYGKVGITCIGDSKEQSEEIYKNFVEAMDKAIIH